MAVVELLPDAKQDFLGASSWYDGRWSGVGEGPFMAAFRRCLALLAEAPERWPVYPLRRRSAPRIRRYVMPGYPYVLPYFVKGDTVVVVAVWHTSRNPNGWLNRLK